MQIRDNLALDLLASAMPTNGYDRLDQAWRQGQFVPLAGPSDPIKTLDAFFSGLEAVAWPTDQCHPAIDPGGLLDHLLGAADPTAVGPDRAGKWLRAAGLAMQPGIINSLLSRLKPPHGGKMDWVPQIAGFIHPDAARVLHLMIEHGLPVATPKTLLAARTADAVRVLVRAGVEPSACAAVQHWTRQAQECPGQFDRAELTGMLAQALPDASPQQQLATLATLAAVLGPQAFKREIKSRGLDPAATLADGRALVEHMALSGLRALFGYDSTSKAWEHQAIDQSKMLLWAASALPVSHPRHQPARAACLACWATMLHCLTRNYGPLTKSPAVASLGRFAGQDMDPVPASVVHDWLVEAVDDGLLDNGSTIAASVLSQPPQAPAMWLSEPMSAPDQVASMALMRLATRHQYDPRWQAPGAKSRLVTPQYDLLSKLAPLLEDHPGLLGSPSCLLVLASHVASGSGPPATRNNRRQLMKLASDNPGSMRIHPSDPDLGAFTAWAATSLAHDPEMAKVVAVAHSSAMQASVDHPVPGKLVRAPRL